MRDVLIVAIVLAGCLAALRRPWIGVILWTWLSVMNPHRYTYGFAYGAPLAAMAVATTVLGLLMTKERSNPFKGEPVVWFALLVVWVTISWLMGLDIEDDFEQWKKVMKIDFMLLVSLALLQTRQHIFALVCVNVGSLAILGAKGGLFTLLNGGSERVWGPPGSFIEDNNEFALAIVMTIPLIRFLQLQISKPWLQHLLTVVMVLCGASALGSQSRGALLASAAMAALFWLRSKDKLKIGAILLLVAIPLVAFMPDSWTNRMETMKTYESDGSAMGRLNAWHTAIGIANHYFFGAGFHANRPELFLRFAPDPSNVLAAHSIYFQMMGNHGWVGLLLFVAMLVSTWRAAGRLRVLKALPPEAQWVLELGAMCQVSLIAFAVGGAFLSLAYFDLPYNIMAMVVLTNAWVQRKGWIASTEEKPARWMTWLHMNVPRKAT